MTLEWLGFKERKKNYAPTAQELTEVAQQVVDRANSAYDGGLRNELLSLTRLLLYSRNEFRVTPSKYFVGGIDVVTEADGKDLVTFSLGVGTNMVSYVNRLALTDREIHKFKPVTDIKSRADLRKVVDDFIHLPPTQSEIIAVDKDSLLKKMSAASNRPRPEINLSSGSRKKNH